MAAEIGVALEDGTGNEVYACTAHASLLTGEETFLARDGQLMLFESLDDASDTRKTYMVRGSMSKKFRDVRWSREER